VRIVGWKPHLSRDVMRGEGKGHGVEGEGGLFVPCLGRCPRRRLLSCLPKKEGKKGTRRKSPGVSLGRPPVRFFKLSPSGLRHKNSFYPPASVPRLRFSTGLKTENGRVNTTAERPGGGEDVWGGGCEGGRGEFSPPCLRAQICRYFPFLPSPNPFNTI
jgi:hypothetical protein